jgi:hypothetical protein
VVRAAPDMAHRPVVVQQPAAARRGIRLRRLTGVGRWASVATLAGIMR